MASSKLLKERIESIQDTRKITNAMYLISSSKLRKARKNYQNVLPYFTRMRDTISRVVPHLPDEPVHPFFHERQREDGDPRRAEPFGERITAHVLRHDGEHAGLVILIRIIDAQPRQNVQSRGKAAHKPLFFGINALRCPPSYITDAFTQTGNAADVVRSGFQPFGQRFGHKMAAAVAAGPAGQKRHPRVPAEQDSCSLRAEKSLVPRHGGKRRAEPRKIEIQDTGALRCVHDQRHSESPAERRDLPHRQNEAEHIGHTGADGSVTLREMPLKPVDQRR